MNECRNGASRVRSLSARQRGGIVAGGEQEKEEGEERSADSVKVTLKVTKNKIVVRIQ